MFYSVNECVCYSIARAYIRYDRIIDVIRKTLHKAKRHFFVLFYQKTSVVQNTSSKDRKLHTVEYIIRVDPFLGASDISAVAAARSG